MLKIRLARGGAKNNPVYRIVVIEKTKKGKGRPVATIGNWHPKKDNFSINKNLFNKWVQHGAQPSQTVKNLVKMKQNEKTT